jgi:hypothetical protein
MAITDFSVNDSGSAKGAFAITLADEDLSVPARALWVGTAGNLKVTMLDGSTATFNNAFGFMPIAVKRVWSTGSSALTDVLGVY